MSRSIFATLPLTATLSAIIACGGGQNGDDVGPDGGVIVNPDGGRPPMPSLCPNECIPTCHLEALQRFEECMPTGTCALDDDTGIENRCYGDGSSQTSDETVTRNNQIWYEPSGVQCFRAQAELENGFVRTAAVYHHGSATPASTVEYPDLLDRTKAVVTCAGQSPRVVDLDSDDCRPCMANFRAGTDNQIMNDDLLALPINPDPPSECQRGTCDPF